MASVTFRDINGRPIQVSDPSELQEIIDATERQIFLLLPALESADFEKCDKALAAYESLRAKLIAIQDQLPAFKAALAREDTIARANNLARKLKNPGSG